MVPEQRPSMGTYRHWLKDNVVVLVAVENPVVGFSLE